MSEILLNLDFYSILQETEIFALISANIRAALEILYIPSYHDLSSSKKRDEFATAMYSLPSSPKKKFYALQTA